MAWHYDRSGMFSIKSAYKLALELEQAEQMQESTSVRGDGSRVLHRMIWLVNVPPKVRIFAWRLAHEGLSTQCNRR
jgi:hypothetical protein